MELLGVVSHFLYQLTRVGLLRRVSLPLMNMFCKVLVKSIEKYSEQHLKKLITHLFE